MRHLQYVCALWCGVQMPCFLSTGSRGEEDKTVCQSVCLSVCLCHSHGMIISRWVCSVWTCVHEVLSAWPLPSCDSILERVAVCGER